MREIETSVGGPMYLDGLGHVRFVTEWPKEHGDAFTATMRILQIKPWHRAVGSLLAFYAIWKSVRA